MLENTDTVFASIMRGLEDALAYARGDTSRGITHVINTGEVNAQTLLTKPVKGD